MTLEIIPIYLWSLTPRCIKHNKMLPFWHKLLNILVIQIGQTTICFHLSGFLFIIQTLQNYTDLYILAFLWSDPHESSSFKPKDVHYWTKASHDCASCTQWFPATFTRLLVRSPWSNGLAISLKNINWDWLNVT